MRRPAARHLVVGASLAALAALAPVGCIGKDPVRERRIEALGPEDPAVPIGPDHRPGQPCLVCHVEGGEASDSPFAVAGTVYETDEPGSRGAADIELEFKDARGGGPPISPVTFPSGNFFVPLSAWPTLTYPFKVRLVQNGSVRQVMTTTVNREGSCNFCHRPNVPADDATAIDVELARRYIGQIFVTRASVGATR